MILSMSSNLVILCPGQGAQAIGMGRKWFDSSPEAKRVFAEADAIVGDRFGAPLSTICFDGPAELLNRTDVSQPAIYVASLASWKGVLAATGMGNGEAGLAATGGLSLGEYTALCVAGAISFEDGLKLVLLRGRAMQDAAESPEANSGGGGGMVALIGAEDAQAQQICDEARAGDVLVCANFNTTGQVVLSGHKSACARAADVATKMGIRSAMLAVSGAFHSSLMRPAADRLQEALAQTTIREPRCRVMSNVTGEPHAANADFGIAESIRRRLVEQLTNPVKWSHNCRWLLSNVAGDYRELAPGKSLSGMIRRLDGGAFKGTKVASHDEPG